MAQMIRWNAERLLRRPGRILVEYGPLISFQLQQEISTVQFPWPVTTRRKSGQLVPAGNRDIVDTARLLNSQTAPLVNFQPAATTLSIRWTAPYSGEVLRGGYLVGTLRNNYVAPPRDWITPALQAQPFRPFFIRRWQQLAGGDG